MAQRYLRLLRKVRRAYQPADQQRLCEAVPKVVELARAAGRRPPLFFRGNDLIDEEGLGFNCVGFERTDHGFPFVVALLFRATPTPAIFMESS